MDSLDLLLDCVRREREAQLAHFDALDSKAGILLGFAGGLIALSPDIPSWARNVSLPLLGLAALLGAAAFFPRRMPTLDVRHLREYLQADEEFTKLRLHDSEVQMIDEGGRELGRKATLMKAAVLFLGLGAVTLAIGIIVGGNHG
jgi:hypothetical protein